MSTLLRIARKRLPKRENVLFDPTLSDDFDTRDPDHVVMIDHLNFEGEEGREKENREKGEREKRRE